MILVAMATPGLKLVAEIAQEPLKKTPKNVG